MSGGDSSGGWGGAIAQEDDCVDIRIHVRLSSVNEVVRLYSYGSSPFHYYWLTGSYWSVSTQWFGVAAVLTYGNSLYGIGLSCGGQGDSQILREYNGYPITLYNGLNIAS